MFYINAHGIFEDFARLWVGTYHIHNIFPYKVEVARDGETYNLVQELSRPEDWVRLRKDEYAGWAIRWIYLDNLESGAHYHARLRIEDTTLARCEFYTLPNRLFAENEKDGPFTVMLGSCFDYQEDGFRASDSYSRIYASKSDKPHLKFLVGDQVYFDSPAADFMVRRSSSWLNDRFETKYARTWLKLKRLLFKGNNFLLSDDHEFWNDYPFTPTPHLLALRDSAKYRKSVKKRALKYFSEIQGGGWGSHQFSIGRQLSFFVVDTRQFRKRDLSEFMKAKDMQKLKGWISNLSCPGVLVIGQPLLYKAVGHFNAGAVQFASDRNLAAFTQYADLSDALSNTKHDIVVLAGDVHFGRISTVTLKRKTGGKPDRKLIEVISSPMSLLKDDFGHTSMSISTQWDPELPVYFPSTNDTNLQQMVPKFERAVSNKQGASGIDSERTAEHFMTLSFEAVPTYSDVSEMPSKAGAKEYIKHDKPSEVVQQPSSRQPELQSAQPIDLSSLQLRKPVRMTVKAWLIRRNMESELPPLDWSWSITLDDYPG